LFGGVVIGRKVIDFVGTYFCNEFMRAMGIADVEQRKTNKALRAVTRSVVDAINAVTLLV
jgi:hypothetical protein